MVSIVESAVLDLPVDVVWRVLRDFNSHRDWHPAIADSRIEEGLPGDAVGAVRRFTLKDGSVLREQLLSLDDEARTLTYCLLEAPIPLNLYVATIALKPVTDGDRCFWQWRSSFEAPAHRRAELESLVRQSIYRAGFRALAAHLGAASPHSAGRPSGRGTAEPQQARSPGPNERGPGAAPGALSEGGGRVSIPPIPIPMPAPGLANVAASAGVATTEAIVVARHGGPDVLVPETIDVPPPGPGEVRVRHAFIGVNFIDIYCRTGYFDLLALPGVPGMEASGRIEAVGPGVSGFSVGDRIAYACPPVGAYAGLRTMRPDLFVKLPPGIDDEIAAASLLKGVSASFLLHDVHRVGPDDVVLVHAAAGGVGSLLTQWAVHLGARVFATVSTDDKVPVVAAFGAEGVIVRRREDFAARIMEATGGQGATVIYDAIGADTFERSLAALAIRGHLVSFGQASGPVGHWDIGRFASRSITVSRPNYGHYTDTAERIGQHAGRFFAALSAGIVRVAPPTVFPLADAARAHAALESGQTTGSIVLYPQGQAPGRP